MADVGEAWQNGYAERLIRTIKEEEVDLSEYIDYNDAYRQLGRFLDDVYMHKRIHSSLGYLTPAEFEAQWRKEQALALDLNLRIAEKVSNLRGSLQRLYQEGMDFIRTHPKQAFSLVLKRFVYFWWFRPGYIKGGVMSGYPWYYGLLYMVSYATFPGFSVFGLILNFGKYRDLFIIYVLSLIQTFVSIVFIAGTRFRGILEPLLIVLAAYGIAWAFPRFFRIFREA